MAAPAAVLADTLTHDQLTQLAAVLLGLVVFAAIFALVERQRARRGGGDRRPPVVEEPTSAPPRTYATPPPAVSTTRPPSQPEVTDELPVPFVPRARDVGAAPPPQEPARPAPPAAPLPTFPTAADPPLQTPPASPDEIGIILPEERPGPEKPAGR